MVSSKRLIVCCDGTWQASDKPDMDKNVESNVTRMCRAISESKKNDKGQQIVYYQSGIGTDVVTDLGAKLAGGSGGGLSENVVEAYNFLCLNYKAKIITKAKVESLDPSESDEIFMFGFSRGAYTVRALSGLVSEIGILRKSMIRYFPEIYKLYQDGHKAEIHALFEKKRQSGQKVHKVSKDLVKIKVVGVWDTVGSLGIPDAAFLPAKFQGWWNKRHAFHDPALSYCIENAFHALALDEHRRPFSPTLWHLPAPEEGKDLPNLVQCWFPGVHINIGGGSKDEAEGSKESMYTDYGELSNITFAWMVDLCREHLTFDTDYLKLFMDHHEILLKEGDEKTGRLPLKGYAQGMINDSFEDAMALGGSRTRAPGQYDVNNHIVVHPSKPSTGTNEYIHPSVRIRIKNRYDSHAKTGEKELWRVWARDTDQRALAGFQIKPQSETDTKAAPRGSGLVWVKEIEGAKEPIIVPEYKISSVLSEEDVTKSLEWRLLEHDIHGALDIVQKLEYPKVLPPAPKATMIGGAASTLSKAIFGYLPSWMHYWEND